MNTLPDLNILPASSRTGKSDGIISGKNNGNDMFQSILDSLNGNNSDSSWVSTLYSDTGTNNPFTPGIKSNTGAVRNGIPVKNTSGNALHKNNHDPEDMTVPTSLQVQLVAFLEKQGFSLKDINRVLSASKNSNGLIKLDKLLEGLSDLGPAGNGKNMTIVAKFKDSFSSFLSEQGIDPDNYRIFFSGPANKNVVLADRINNLLTGNQKERSFIEPSQIPGVQDILFKMGLGVGEVKKIIENSKNGEGELALEKLSAELNKFFSSALSESDLSSLFSKNNISVEKRLFSTVNSISDKSNLTADKNIHRTDEAQKEIKQNIEALLKEKGIGEENIKSILDKIETAFSKTKLEKGSVSGESTPGIQKLLTTLTGEKQIISGVFGDSIEQNISAFLKKKGASEKDVRSFLYSFSLDVKKANSVQGDNCIKSSLLNEKAFGLLKNDQLASADQGNLKLNLSEILKLAEKKANETQLSRLIEGNIQTETSAKNGTSVKERNEFLLKETQQLSGINITQQKEINNIGKVIQTNAAVNLPEPLPRIIDRMFIMLRTGEYKSRLQITPPELGKLEIDLTVKNGHIHANLSTENALVKEIIEANLNQLKQQLSNQGLTVEKFDVMVGLDYGKREESNNRAEGRNGRGSGRNTGSKSDTTGEIPASQPLGRGLISNSRVDVHV